MQCPQYIVVNIYYIIESEVIKKYLKSNVQRLFYVFMFISAFDNYIIKM